MGCGETVKEGLTIVEVKEMIKGADVEPSHATVVLIKPVVGEVKDYRKEPESKPKRRGRTRKDASVK